MSIEIEKMGSQFRARVRGLPVEGGSESLGPMSYAELFRSLKALGCDPRDIMDAFLDADPSLAKGAYELRPQRLENPSESIAVSREGDLFRARYSPPDARGSPWESPHPMAARELYTALIDAGVSPVDVLQAFREFDPELALRVERRE